MSLIKQLKKCMSCSHVDHRELSKLDASFVETLEWSGKCASCGGKRFHIEYGSPPLDAEIMTYWIQNDEVSFLEQDEELIIGEYENIKILDEFLSFEGALERKRIIILEALYVMIYDAVSNNEAEIVTAGVKVLMRHGDLVLKNREEVMEYLREIVDPLIE